MYVVFLGLVKKCKLLDFFVNLKLILLGEIIKKIKFIKIEVVYSKSYYRWRIEWKVIVNIENYEMELGKLRVGRND